MDFLGLFFDLIVAFSAAIVASVSIIGLYSLQKWNRQEKKASTFDLILNLGITRPDVFSEAPGQGFDPGKLVKRQFSSSEEKLKYEEILRYLNRLEAVAIGIREGFYDEEILVEFLGLTLVRAYRETQEIIDEIRHYTNNPLVFVNLEAIARRWEEIRWYES